MRRGRAPADGDEPDHPLRRVQPSVPAPGRAEAFPAEGHRLTRRGRGDAVRLRARGEDREQCDGKRHDAPQTTKNPSVSADTDRRRGRYLGGHACAPLGRVFDLWTPRREVRRGEERRAVVSQGPPTSASAGWLPGATIWCPRPFG